MPLCWRLELLRGIITTHSHTLIQQHNMMFLNIYSPTKYMNHSLPKCLKIIFGSSKSKSALIKTGGGKLRGVSGCNSELVIHHLNLATKYTIHSLNTEPHLSSGSNSIVTQLLWWQFCPFCVPWGEKAFQGNNSCFCGSTIAYFMHHWKYTHKNCTHWRDILLRTKISIVFA